MAGREGWAVVHDGDYVRIIYDDLPLVCPACERHVGVFGQVGGDVAVDGGADAAFCFVREGCVGEGEVLFFGGAAAVGEVGCVWGMYGGVSCVCTLRCVCMVWYLGRGGGYTVSSILYSVVLCDVAACLALQPQTA